MLSAAEPTLEFQRHARDLRDMWQGRALARAQMADREYVKPRDPIGMVMLSVLSHNFDETMPVLLRVVFPAFRSIAAPFLCSAGKIAKTDHVMADVMLSDGRIAKNQALFRNTSNMQNVFRRFADELRLTDAERVAMFDAVKRWVVCDYRIDPTMDPADPDSRRLKVH